MISIKHTYLINACQANLLDKVENELQAFTNSLEKSPKFASFLGNPTVSRSAKASMIQEVVGDSTFTHITSNLLLTLAANGRIGETNKVRDCFYMLPFL